MLKNKTILITGGTGSLGNAITRYIFNYHKDVKKVIIFSRDEQKQFLMAQEYPSGKYPQMRFFIGDIRDRARLKRAFSGVDYVIHCAAMKHVHISEYNPDECIKTNIGGAENIVEVALESDVSRVVSLSTDKACAPINLYGATKLTSDKLFIAANNIKGNNPVKFSVVRYGNVMGSNGSVIPFFLNKKKEGILPITNTEMTRFNITLEAAVDIVFYALEHALGGELYVPKIASYKIMDLANAICRGCKKPVTGIRPGEKIHEQMISESDSFNTYDIGKYYVIIPAGNNYDIKYFIKKYKANPVKKGFSYSSNTNEMWETVDTLRKGIKKNVDLNFLHK